MPESSFSGKTVVLTGVGRPGQAGEAIAKAFADKGAHLVLLDRDESVGARAADITSAGGAATSYVCDLTRIDEVLAVAEQVGKAHSGKVDALINVAGGFAMSGPVAESDIAVLQKQLAINLTTAYAASRAFLPLVRMAQGCVVYFASAAVLPGGSGAKMSAYAASKAGLLALMRAVAEEEAPNGVRANAVAPTAIRTADNLKSMGDKMRYVTREALAETVLFLCSPESGYVTGQVVRLG